MTYVQSGVLLLGSAALLGPGLANAQTKFDFGKREYQSNCASCHGVSGRGDGVLRPHLDKSPSDLTVLASRNKGVFPYQRVYEFVDGRQSVALHGARDMPVWGADYNVKSAQDWQDWPYDSESYVRSRITALVEYIYRLQQR